MSYDKRIYLELLYKEKYDEANRYRANNMPKSLFKYISLSGGIDCELTGETCSKTSNLNELKFNTLENNNLWLSNFTNLNDPFEYKSLFLHKEKLEAANYSIEFIESAFESIKNYFVISSFTTTAINNMPMWAHYANNHQGFCVEYEVINPGMIFQVSYEDERIGMASIITNCIYTFEKLRNDEIDESNAEYQKYVHIMLSNAFIKHKTWSYEDEYRLVFINPNRKSNGVLYSLDLLGLKVKSVFIGKCCSAENRQRLINIASKNGFGVNDIILEEQSELYELEAKPINVFI